jgi:hypothetical protein
MDAPTSPPNPFWWLRRVPQHHIQPPERDA